MQNRIYDDLPAGIAAIKTIMRQPFYGYDRRDFRIEYIYSHAFWYVGDHAGLMRVRSRCVKEAVDMEEGYFKCTGKRLSL